MPILDGTLETIGQYGTQGWSAIHDANIEKLDATLKNIILADQIPGQTAVADPDAATAGTLTPGGGTPSTTIATVSGSGDDTNINNNFASLTDQINKLVADNTELRNQVVALLAALRQTGGCGIVQDNP